MSAGTSASVRVGQLEDAKFDFKAVNNDGLLAKTIRKTPENAVTSTMYRVAANPAASFGLHE